MDVEESFKGVERLENIFLAVKDIGLFVLGGTVVFVVEISVGIQNLGVMNDDFLPDFLLIFSSTYEMQKTQEVIPIEVHHIRFDDIAFSTNPFELFLNCGNQIRARSKAKQTLSVSVTFLDRQNGQQIDFARLRHKNRQ